MDTDARLKQIEKIAQNARTTWFGLLALLVFVGVTLMGHKDSDFFAYGAATKLPIVGIEVPPTAFFIAAPILTAALYCYLHIYLLGLWDALGKTEQPQPRKTNPLGNLVYPMLFTIAALWYRDARRGDGSMPPRVLGMWTVIIAVLLGWVFGWIVLGFAWWRSMSAHDPLITIVSGLALWAAIDFGVNGFLWAEKSLRDPSAEAHTGIRPLRIFSSAVLVIVLADVSVQRTRPDLFVDDRTDPLIPIAQANLAEAHLTAKPKDWLDYEDWKKEYAYTFRRREGIATADQSKWTEQQRADLQVEYKERWASLAGSLDKISLRGRDLRGANIAYAFLVGADLRCDELPLDAPSTQGRGCARLDGSDLSYARLEGAILWGARMEKADLYEVRMEGAFLWKAELEGANLKFARLDSAVLWEARLEGADLRSASLAGSDCSSAVLIVTLAHSADLTCLAETLRQNQLKLTVGDNHTLLRYPLKVWSCLDRADHQIREMMGEIEAALAKQPIEGFGNRLSRTEFENRLWCKDWEEPRKVGRWIEDQE